MKTAREVDATPQEAVPPPETWPEEPACPQEGAASAEPGDPAHETLEEPGYGHGV